MTDSRVNEETPLLSPPDDTAVTTSGGSNEVTTPLPKFQIGILLSAQVAEGVCSRSLSPFINQVNITTNAYGALLMGCQLISELGITGGDDRKLGYYVGG